MSELQFNKEAIKANLNRRNQIAKDRHKQNMVTLFGYDFYNEKKSEEIQIDMFELERRYAVFEEWCEGIVE